MKQNTNKTSQKAASPSVFGLLGPYRGMVTALVVLSLLGSGVNLVLPWLVARAIDAFAKGTYDVRLVVLQFLVASLAIFIFTYVQNILQTFSSERVARDMRRRISDKISKQSFAYIQRTSAGRLLTNLTSDVESIKLFVAQAVVSIVSSVVMIVGTSVMLISINYKLAVPVLFIIPLIMGSFFFILSKVRVYFKEAREVVDWLNRVINESILGAAVIRVLHSQHLEYNKFLEANKKSQSVGMSILRLFAILVPIITLSASLAMLTILVLGGRFVMTGEMTMGQFSAFFSYVSLLIFPIMVIGFMSNIIGQAQAAYSRIWEVLMAEEPQNTGTIETPLEGNVELQNLTVNYGGKLALKNVSLSLRKNTRTAIIGPTAAGKSQLLYCLTGLVLPSDGKILFDGKELCEYNHELFNRQIGMVFQDSIIFNMSLRENISFGNTASDEDLALAIDTAELRDFIAELPEGLDTVVSERGTSLSGGQKQRIMLARALALNPKLLLLDDFTARVDTPTERRILENVLKNYTQITILSVTQKIESIVDFDHVVLLMEGDILAQGSHAELMNTCPEYVQIYDSQRSTNLL